MTQAAPTIYFAADRTLIRPGECTTIRWHVEGVKAVYFFAKGQGWKGNGVVGVGEREVCPSQTTEYRLRVIKRDGSAVVRKIQVQVQALKGSGAVKVFSVDRLEIQPGECAIFCWQVEGVKAVYFFAEGEPWQDHGVAGGAEQRVCPSQTTTYCLRVVNRDDSVEVHRIPVQVQAPSDVVQVFAVDPTEIQPGECANFRWHVEGVKAVYFYPEGQNWQDHGTVGVGEKQVCPAQTTTYCLRVVRRDDSVQVDRIPVQVQAPSDVVQVFSVDRMEIQPGECVRFRWQVSGVKGVYFYAEGQNWQDHGVVGGGERQACPSQTTTYCLRVVKQDDSVENHYIRVQVRG